MIDMTANIASLLVAALILGGPASEIAAQDVADGFVARSFKASNGDTMPYRLFVPDATARTQRLRAFWVGIGQHEKGAAVWNKHLDARRRAAHWDRPVARLVQRSYRSGQVHLPLAPAPGALRA